MSASDRRRRRRRRGRDGRDGGRRHDDPDEDRGDGVRSQRRRPVVPRPFSPTPIPLRATSTASTEWVQLYPQRTHRGGRERA
jgi:ribosome assembly protein YihI (activator of Der GTPase)